MLSSAGVLLAPGCKKEAHFDAELQRLSPDERVMIERFAEVYIPTEGTDLKPLSEVPYLDNIDGVLAHVDRPTLEEIHMGLKLFDYGPYVIGFHFRRFAKLAPAEREVYIREWDEGGETQRGLVGLIKKLVAVGYWQDVEAARRVGYQGPVSREADIISLGNAPMPVAHATPTESP